MKLHPLFGILLLLCIATAPEALAVNTLTTGLLTHYNMSDATDSSGNAHTLTKNNAVSFRTGLVNNESTNFSSANYYSAANAAWMYCLQIRSNCTLSFTFNTTSTSTYQNVLDHRTQGGAESNGDVQYDVFDGAVNTFYFDEVEGGAARSVNLASGLPINKSVTVYIEHKANGTTDLYYNGVLNASADFSAYTNTSVSENMIIGYSNGTGAFSGGIDEISVWNRILTASEITQHYGNVSARIGFPWSSPAPANSPPVMVSGSVALTSNNQTLILTANATDSDNATITYTYTVVKGGVNQTTLSSGLLAQGISTNYANYSLSSAPGNYSVIVYANDGVANSSTNTSNTVEATFPTTASSTVCSDAGTLFFSDHFMLFMALILAAFICGFVATKTQENVQRIAVVAMAGIIVVIFLIAYITLAAVC